MGSHNVKSNKKIGQSHRLAVMGFM